MRLFGFRKYETLANAVRAGDLRAVRKMLASGANPNVPAPNDDTVPIFYALHEGPDMVQALIENGAEVNVTMALIPSGVVGPGGRPLK